MVEHVGEVVQLLDETPLTPTVLLVKSGDFVPVFDEDFPAEGFFFRGAVAFVIRELGESDN